MPAGRTGAAAATAAVLAATLAGCAPGAVRVQAPPVSGTTSTRCAGLVQALPRAVADQKRRTVDAGPHEYVAAWGDPPIVLRCGVAKPRGLNRFAPCQQVNGVGWFVPPREIDRGPGPIVMTTIGLQPRVQVRLPGDYWPPAAAMADLATAVKTALRRTHSCV